MRHINIIRRSVSLVAMIAAMPATALSQDENADDEFEIEEIIVTGIRASLESAIAIKRAADTVIEVITSVDIGEFSDDSIAGAIARIPGIQIETDDAGTDGDRVSIRGLGPEFVNSTINGRRLLSSGNEARSLRKMNFNAFPPSVLAGVHIAKGQSAHRPESGLAGQVDLRTLRPLEIGQLKKNNTFGVVSVKGSTQTITNEKGYRLSAIGGRRNDDETVGGYLAIVYADERNARDQLALRYATKTIKTTEGDVAGVNAINVLTMSPIREKPERTAVATGLQLRPRDDLEIIFDVMYSKYNNKSHRNQNQFSMNDTWQDTVFDTSDPDNMGVIIDENNIVRYINYSNATAAGALTTNFKTMRFNNVTENFIGGVNVEYISDNLTTNFDVYVSTLDYAQDLRFPIAEKTLAKDGFIYDATGTLPILIISDAADLDGFNYSRAVIREIRTKGTNYGTTLNFNYAFITGIISSIDFGSHYDTMDIMVQRTNNEERRIDAATGAAILDAAITGTIDEDFLSSKGYSPARWFAMDFNEVAALDPTVSNYSWDEIGVRADSSFDMKEDIFTLFAQANLTTDVGEMPLMGNIGLRAVRTKNVASAQGTLDGTDTVFEVSNTYWSYLPSLNLKLQLTDTVNLRFGAFKTLSRPDYQSLAPINEINLADDDGDGSATVGNPDLKPMRSTNFDLTLAWDNEYDGSVTFSYFYKDVKDFIIQNTVSQQPLEGYEGLYDVKTYRNFSDGKASGFEVGFFQPLGSFAEVLKGFGLSANYTYVDSSFDEDVGDAGHGFPGSSKDNINLMAYYEQDKFSVRVSYIYRGSFFRSLSGTGSQTNTARFTGATENLNLNVTVNVFDRVTLRFSANNLTNSQRRDFIGSESTFLTYYDGGRSYSMTATYKF